jgi:hypothetical protein
MSYFVAVCRNLCRILSHVGYELLTEFLSYPVVVCRNLTYLGESGVARRLCETPVRSASEGHRMQKATLKSLFACDPSGVQR